MHQKSLTGIWNVFSPLCTKLAKHLDSSNFAHHHEKLKHVSQAMFELQGLMQAMIPAVEAALEKEIQEDRPRLFQVWDASNYHFKEINTQAMPTVVLHSGCVCATYPRKLSQISLI